MDTLLQAMGALLGPAVEVLVCLFALAAAYRGALWALGSLDSTPRGDDLPEEDLPHCTVLVPAHDEEGLLPACLDSLRSQRYPADRLSVVVLADRCTDATPRVAALAGAEVWERREGAPGKGPLLRWAVGRLAPETAEGGLLAVLDADTVASPSWLREAARRTAGGAPAVQAHHGVRDPGRSALATLMEAAARGRRRVLAGRERLGLASPLLGTGMVFLRRALSDGWCAEGLAEDREMGAALALGGRSPRFSAVTEVRSEPPAGLAGARRQRLRWTRGEARVAGRYAFPLLARGAAGGDVAAAELGLDLLLPSTSARAACLAALAGGAWVSGRPAAGCAAAAVLAIEALPFLSGLLTQGVRGLSALVLSPLYVGWKALLLLEAALPGPHPWIPTRGGRE